MKRLLLLLLLLPVLVTAGNYKIQFKVPANNQGVAIDGYHVVVTTYNDANDDLDTIIDSTQTNGADSVWATLDSAKWYQVRQSWSYANNDDYSIPYDQTLPPLLVSASASVNYASIESLLVANHGSGSYAAGGAGEVPCEFTVLNSTDSSVVQGIHVHVYNTDTAWTVTNRNSSARTLSNGIAGLNLGSTSEDDSLVVTYYCPGWTFDGWDSMVVEDTGMSLTAYATQFTPSAPSDSFTCNVYGWLADIGGTPTWKRRQVTFTLADRVQDTCNGWSIIDPSDFAEVQADGKFEIHLLRCACLVDRDDENPRYLVEIEGISGGKLLTVPDSATHELIWKDLDDAN